MKLKKVVLFISCSFFSLLVKADTDAIILTSKSAISIASKTHLVDTGITIENGDVWVWGFRNSGQQGNGVSHDGEYKTPARVAFFANKGIDITQLAAGIYHIIALDEKGNVWGWGQNGYHEASGNGNATSYPSVPVLVLENENVVMIGTGEYISYALTKSGDVYTWGHGIYGQTANGGRNTANDIYKIPREYFNNRPVVLLGAAYESGYAINDAGEVFGWGDDESNAFGFENPTDHVYRTRPIQITNLPSGVSGKDIVYIAGGDRYTAFLTSSGDVYGMGAGSYIGIGMMPGRNVTTPRRIIGNIDMLYCRYVGCVAVDKDKGLWTWGATEGSAFKQIYGNTPTRRTHNGILTKIDGGKEHIIYWNDEGKAYGVGYGAGHKFSQQSNENVNWPGKELDFVINAMKRVYGLDYIPGQGQ
ncbi:RCC1 domain-containing protein [Gilliamella sp. BG7]|uniref:RCC1 domain-containing protein n=1 Tax=unclassified Gilliamella TaxID=2685620 RepID=UPI0039857FD3